MKTFQFLLLFLFISLTAHAQFEPCSLQGAGSADGGTDPVDCGATVNYSFQNAEGIICYPPGNDEENWSWCIESLGLDGFVQLDQNTTFPESFTMSNGVEGLILSASYLSITIQWNCNDCTGGVEHIDIFNGCNEEIYQSSVFVQCTPDVPPSECSTDTWDCVSTDCDCIKVCINGQVQILENEEGGEVFFCYPEGTSIGAITSCDLNLFCKNTPPDDFPNDGSSGSELVEDDESGKRHIVIPDVKIVQINKGKGAVNLTIELPKSNKPFDLTLYDSSGRTAYSKSLVNQFQAIIEVNSLQTGIYHVLLTDGNYRITQKIFVH